MTERADPALARRIELILSQVDALPTLSPIAARLLEVSSADDTDVQEIVRLIESDPALTGRILALCRRAERGLGGRIGTVKHAVLMLGLEAVQAAVLSVCVYELLDPNAAPIPEEGTPDRARHNTRDRGLDRVGFWKHAVAVACAAELIAEGHPKLGVIPEEGFVAGLLHDLGKLVLDLIVPRSYTRVVALAEQRRCPAAEAEHAVIGLDHHVAGKRLAEHWALPHALQDVMWLHSQPQSSVPNLPHRDLIGLVTMAKALCRRLHIGWSGEFGPPPNLEPLCEQLGLNRAVVEAAAPRLHAAVSERCAALDLDSKTSPELLLQSIANANRKLGRLNEALDVRVRQARRQSRVLEAVSRFHADGRPGRGVVETFAQVVKTARELLGPGYYAALFQPRAGEPCHLLAFNAEARPTTPRTVQPPRRAADELSSLSGEGHLSFGAAGTLSWLSDHLRQIPGAPEPHTLRVMPLPTAAESDGQVCILIHDRPMPEGVASGPEMRALAATWGAAVAAASAHEGARRLSEQLAETNRSLVEARSLWAEAQSLVRLGEMAAGAAHEMNNPLTVISGRSQLLVSRLTERKDKAAAACIAEAAQHLSNLITSLRLLADPPAPAIKAVPVKDLISAAVALAEARAGAKKGRVKVALPEGPLDIELDRELVESAIAEPIINALEATAAASDGRVEVHVQEAPDDDRILIAINDKGPGMSDRALQHAFDPFFSDKPAGRQTGLGLTRARRLLELHGGTIRIDSTDGGGTDVTIALPMVTPRPARQPAPAAGAEPKARAA